MFPQSDAHQTSERIVRAGREPSSRAGNAAPLLLPGHVDSLHSRTTGPENGSIQRVPCGPERRGGTHSASSRYDKRSSPSASWAERGTAGPRALATWHMLHLSIIFIHSAPHDPQRVGTRLGSISCWIT